MSIRMLATAAAFLSSFLIGEAPKPRSTFTNFYPQGRGTSGAAGLKRAARKRRNIRTRSPKK